MRLLLSLSLLHAQVTDDYTVIGRNLFKKETNLQLFVGLKVTLSTGETGVIEGGFGQSGKFKIRVQGKDPLQRRDVSETPSPLSDPSANDGAASRRPSHFKLIGVVEFHFLGSVDPTHPQRFLRLSLNTGSPRTVFRMR